MSIGVLLVVDAQLRHSHDSSGHGKLHRVVARVVCGRQRSRMP